MKKGSLTGLLVPHSPTMLEPGMHQVTINALITLARELAENTCLVVVSPHWVGRGEFLLQAAAQPECIQDYYGFPEPYYQCKYAARGVPTLAQDLAQGAKDTGIPVRATTQWGLDHAHWVPLMYLAPQAQLPVMAVSNSTTDPQHQRSFGAFLAHQLVQRNEKPLFIASIALTHRLDLMGRGGSYGPGREFDHLVADLLTKGAWAEIYTLASHPLFAPAAPEGDLGPLHILLGAMEAMGGTAATVLADEEPFPGIGMVTVDFRHPV